MPPFDSDLLLHWLSHTAQLAQRLCVVAVAAAVCIRAEGLRRAIHGSDWRSRLVAAGFFGLLAMIGTHGGIVMDLERDGRVGAWDFSGLPGGLGESQAILGFRDSMALVAGLVGGPWVGGGAGLLAGLERISLGSFVALPSGLSTFVLGLGAGFASRMRPLRDAGLWGALAVALAGTLVNRLLLVSLAPPDHRSELLGLEIAIPILAANGLGCVLFLWILRDLEQDRLAALRLRQAEIEPHFLNNTLNAIDTLISLEPARASAYLVRLARFFDQTRRNAAETSIPLAREAEHLERYLELQALRFGADLVWELHIPPALAACPVPPRCLLTLAENALIHGFDRRRKPLRLVVTAASNRGGVQIELADDGRGMEPARAAALGRKPVRSTVAGGSGTGLANLAESLLLAYGPEARLACDSAPGHGTRVRLVLPWRPRP